ncbi:MAG: glycosyltransferase [Nitrospirota bacterium]
MKIGVFLTKLETFSGGAFSLQDTIVKDLLKVKSKHEFTIFYRGQMDFNKNTSVKFVPLDTSAGSKPLDEALLEHQIDIVWFLSLTYEKVNIPFIFPVLDLQHRLQPFFPEVSISGFDWDGREAFYSHILPRATYIITATDTGRNEIAQFYQIPFERIKKIPRPVSSFALEYAKMSKSEISKIGEILSSRYSTFFNKNNKDFLFYPAQFWPHKNHISILLALKILQEKYSLDFPVVFTGSDHGNKKYIQEKVSELRLTNNVFFGGLVSFEVLSWLYRKAFALIFPTFFGPDNLPPLEAFALGCPVIASDVPGAQEQLGDAAILINPKSEEEIANAIKKLHDEPDLRQVLIKRGYDKVRKLQANNYIDSIISILDEFEPIRRCWSNKEIYQYIIQNGTIEEGDGQSYPSGDVSEIAEGNQEKHIYTEMLEEEIDKINKLLESRRFEEADIAIKQAIEKYPDSLDLLSLQAILKIYIGDKEEAKVILLDLIKRWPTNYTAYNNLGLIFYESGDFDNAVKYFEDALRISQFDRSIVLSYGDMLMSYKKFARAKELYAGYLKTNPNDEEIRLLLQKCDGVLGKVRRLGQIVEGIK